MIRSMKLFPDSFRTGVSRRAALRTLAAAAGALAAPPLLAKDPQSPAVAPQAAPDTPQIGTTSLGKNLSLITGAGGNILVLKGDDGALVVDSGLESMVTGTAAAIHREAPEVALLINTHWHFDHAGGNQRVVQMGAQVVAHQNCRSRLAEDQTIEFFNRKIKATPPQGLPRIALSHETQLHVNGEVIRIIPVPPAHTDGDVAVFFTKANLVHMGDLHFHQMYPFIDYSSGGWIGGLIPAVRLILEMTDEKTQVIPGHGSPATAADLRQYLEFLETIYNRLLGLQDAGKTVEEAVESKPTAEFDQAWSGGLLSPDDFVRCAYTGLLRHGKRAE
jgi:cyclase